MTVVGIMGVDDTILHRCPRGERVIAGVGATIALLNALFIGLAVADGLVRVGESVMLAGSVACFGSWWFLLMQRLLLVTHGARRGLGLLKVTRLVPYLFLGFFAYLVSCELSMLFQEVVRGESLASESFQSVTHVVHPSLLALILSSFLFPLFARPLLMDRGEYGLLLAQSEREALALWQDEWARRYEAYVRSELGVENYRCPPMLLGDR